MLYPKIQSLQLMNDYNLLVKFDNQQMRTYDVKPLLKQERFFSLKNPVLFKQVQIEIGGYAVYWNDEIDLSEHEIWLHGVPFVFNDLSKD